MRLLRGVKCVHRQSLDCCSDGLGARPRAAAYWRSTSNVVMALRARNNAPELKYHLTYCTVDSPASNLTTTVDISAAGLVSIDGLKLMPTFVECLENLEVLSVDGNPFDFESSRTSKDMFKEELSKYLSEPDTGNRERHSAKLRKSSTIGDNSEDVMREMESQFLSFEALSDIYTDRLTKWVRLTKALEFSKTAKPHVNAAPEDSGEGS
ncbi:unnamed protein product [Mesocestoides corti]|uniref:Uncharacterized protein n=1 Tax=Mesocestoides corti TaxID=53468 RepID=A0A0R3UIV8_MESCO|nr:unnamed protein product [Mesocestoides corti]